jgi:hypothetical protein
VIDRAPHGKKSLDTQEQFEKLLQKRCPWHPNGKHATIDCLNLRRTFNAPPLNKDKRKGKEKEYEEDEEKLEGYHDAPIGGPRAW